MKFYLLCLLVLLASCAAGGTYPDNPSSSIADGTTNVSIAGPFTMTFAFVVYTDTVTVDTFYLTGPAASPSIVKGAFNATACDIANRVGGTVSCASGTECSFVPTNSLNYNTQYAFCLTSGIRYTNDMFFNGLTILFTTEAPPACTPPTCAEIHAAIIAANTTGMRPSVSFSSVILPEFDCAQGATVIYSMSDLPAWLAFDATTRALTLNNVSTIPSDATSEYTATYASTIDSQASSVSCLLNDMDDDTIIDYTEYKYGEVPLVNPTIGWIWLDPATDLLYRPERSSFKTIPTGLIVPTKGLNLNDPADAAQDFDSDTLTNLMETQSGTNVFVALSDGTFAAAVPPTYAVGTGPFGITTGDFNGDGALDLAVINNTDNDISILRGVGDGTFPTKVDYAVGTGPSGITTGDFNGDGALDLAVANGADNNISVLLGEGDGIFAAAVPYNVGTLPTGITTGDFDGDGDLDLAVTNIVDNTISVLLGEGDGTFAAAVPPTYTVGAGPLGITTGDFNGDGALDLAVTNGGLLDDGTTISILLGVGDGTFPTKVDYAVGTGPGGITTGDFNGNGVLDLAVANNTDNDISILLGVGDGTFPTKVDYAVGTGPGGITTADFNGDGVLDLAVTNNGSGAGTTISILLGVGDGTFPTKVDYTVGAGPLGITAGDFNGDGALDLAVTNLVDDDISVLLNQ